MSIVFVFFNYTHPGCGNIASFKGLKYITLALVSAQTLFMWLGDLSRYREQLNGNKNFGRSKQWYVKAQQLIPSNGKPYNQLAIVSIKSVSSFVFFFNLIYFILIVVCQQKRKFDAVYYHMRSLTASNPIHSARESLKVLFDETRKKVNISHIRTS